MMVAVSQDRSVTHGMRPNGARAFGMSKRCGFTLTELVIVIVLLGILTAVAAPRFFSQGVFENANTLNQFQSGLSYTRNRAITTQCSHEFRLDSGGWSVLRDSDCQIDTSGCPLELNVTVSDPDGGALAGSAATASLQRLIFTPDGRLYQLTSGSGCTTLPANAVAADTTLSITPSATLRLDGMTAYAALQ